MARRPYDSKLSRADAQLRLMAASGSTLAELAEALEASSAGIRRYCRRYGITVQRKPKAERMTTPRAKKDWGADERAQRMASMFRQGLTLQKIGDQFALTRERVRQIFRHLGIKRADGGQAMKGALREQHRQAGLEARSIQKWGVSHARRRELRANGLLRSFEEQRRNSHSRGIDWKLSLAEWLSVWEASGKLDLRGKGKGRYCMSRIRDDGDYELGNVHVQLCTDNSREAVAQWKGKTKENRGVFLLYPNCTKPWYAKVGKRWRGYFATEADAVAARNAFLADDGLTVSALRPSPVDAGDCLLELGL